VRAAGRGRGGDGARGWRRRIKDGVEEVDGRGGWGGGAGDGDGRRPARGKGGRGLEVEEGPDKRAPLVSGSEREGREAGALRAGLGRKFRWAVRVGLGCRLD
jgi:hypothetical protein